MTIFSLKEIISNRLLFFFIYRHIPAGAVGQERLWTLLVLILERKPVVARRRGFLNLDKVLIGPGRQAVLIKLTLNLVGQSLVSNRTGPVILHGKLTVSEKNKGIMSNAQKRQGRATGYFECAMRTGSGLCQSPESRLHGVRTDILGQKTLH